jgi:exosortase
MGNAEQGVATIPAKNNGMNGKNTQVPQRPFGLDWWQIVVLVGLIAGLYYRILIELAHTWAKDENFSHGYFVPLFCAYVIWQKRHELAAVPKQSSAWGALIIAGALLTLTVGILGSELFLSRTSLILLVGGIIIYFWGWGFFSKLAFPWAFLFLMVPIPAIIFNQITFPLQILASKLASAALPLFGVPVLREGNIIELPAMPLEVAEACSGIRSLLSLGTLAIIYGYFLETKISRRVLLALASIPIAVAANAFRIVGTGLLVQYWDPDKALGFFHEFSGWVIFIVSLFLLLIFQRAMKLLDYFAPEAK